jgi:hypothetical protein
VSERAKQAAILRITNNLYGSCPNAAPVPVENGVQLWGEVENTPEYEFCNSIANLIVRHSALTFVDQD